MTKCLPMNAFPGLTFIAFGIVLAIPVTIFTVSFAWVFYRPKIGILMLLLSILMIAGIYFYAYQHQWVK